MSLENEWCFACKNCSQEYPKNEANEETFKILSKEYKHIIYCVKNNCFVVANDNMWINKRETCPSFKDKEQGG